MIGLEGFPRQFGFEPRAAGVSEVPHRPNGRRRRLRTEQQPDLPGATQSVRHSPKAFRVEIPGSDRYVYRLTQRLSEVVEAGIECRRKGVALTVINELGLAHAKLFRFR